MCRTIQSICLNVCNYLRTCANSKYPALHANDSKLSPSSDVSWTLRPSVSSFLTVPTSPSVQASTNDVFSVVAAGAVDAAGGWDAAARGLSARIRVKAAAASSKAQETLDVRRRNTSGSPRCLPSFDDSWPIPGKGITLVVHQIQWNIVRGGITSKFGNGKNETNSLLYAKYRKKCCQILVHYPNSKKFTYFWYLDSR